ncbi:MAG: O-antigen polymerase [Ramlibacter sp.]|nr:O-antigen polymerase [Ramlibacter sp.]
MTSFALLFASWVMPLHFPPWVSWHNEVLAFLSATALGWALWRSVRQGGAQTRAAEIPRASILFIFLGVVVFVQAATGLITFRGDALVLEVYLLLCLLALVAGFSWSRANSSDVPSASKGANDLLQAMAWTLLAGALASALIALVQVFDVWSDAAWIVRMYDVRRPGANLGQPNHLATLLLMGIASLLYLHEAKRLSAVSALLGFLVLSAVLAIAESRTGVLSFLLLCAWWAAGRARAGLTVSPWVVAIAAAWFMLAYVTWPVLMSSTQVLEAGAQINAQPGMRLVVWPQLLEAVAMRPWLGWGLREVSEAHNAVASNYSLSEPYTYSHNIVLDLALGVGLPLTALLVLAVTVWVVGRVRSARSLIPWYCLAAVLPLAVHSMLEFPFSYAYFLVPALFLVGVLEARSGAKPFARLTAKPMAAGLLIATAAGAWSVVEYLRIEEDFRVARFEALRIGRTQDNYERPTVYLLTQLDALLHGARIVPRPGMSAADLELAREVALRFPWPATQNRYALSLALNGNPTEGLRQLQVIRALHGEAAYLQIKANWETLGESKYELLGQLALP